MKVFYTPEQSVVSNQSYSPSAGKPQQLVNQWRQMYGDRLEIIAPVPVTVEDLALAHDRDYVEDVLSCRRTNGFSNQSPHVAASLPWTTGSLVSACRHVVEHGGVACSPTSGFHHAHYDSGGDFCTFNGLIVAAILARRHLREKVPLGAPRGAQRIGILDCDFHYGNGTDHILEKMNIDYVAHWTTGAGQHDDPEAFISDIPQLIEEMEVGLLIYQAGADAHIDDPLGGWMDDDQMRRRDRAVFQYCSANRLPVAWNLAGGYQPDLQLVLNLHHATMDECLQAFHP